MWLAVSLAAGKGAFFMATEGPKQTVFFCEGHNGNAADGFGRSTANPVLCSSVVGGYFYLDRLESLDGAKLLFARIRTQRLDNGHTLDCYRITKEGEAAESGFDLYIDGYTGRDSTEAPPGCRLRSGLSQEMRALKSRLPKEMYGGVTASPKKTGCLVPLVLILGAVLAGCRLFAAAL